MFRKMFSVTVILVCTLGTVVHADPPTLAIQQQAVLDPMNFGVLVTVAVDCGASAPSEFQLEVVVRQEDVAGTSGGVFLPATAGKQVVTLDVFGPFVAGDASASATLVCGPLLEGLELGAAIKIVQ
jgi:hypothetical protein